MSIDRNAPISSVPGGIWLQRVVGLLATIAGLAFAGLFAYITYKVLLRPAAVEVIDIGVLATLAAIAAFLLISGFRMLLNRPNRHGSAVSPIAWYITAAVFLMVAAWVFTHGVTSGASSGYARPAVIALFFSLSAAGVGWRTSRKARSS
jgi:hypothetical protein